MSLRAKIGWALFGLYCLGLVALYGFGRGVYFGSEAVFDGTTWGKKCWYVYVSVKGRFVPVSSRYDWQTTKADATCPLFGSN
jgi:hypothetical protein